ncbi:outer membrane protein OmpA-like peptidoglycan-associated protein/tetratricopeptide (TPR) repeat protein [Filimonas zeae]|uniref:OmpA-like domain-containing protein n=1 Tax=Filimonas zeae TaxID=1737353 RepID=A0A917MUL5_9BACT|nr:OmpA family protein [Filimonas zeae]MDR6339098.1 outer membrane protein OmpA-like peptidoglycan-associated protein/tetratricopeptide (TPR) repeat protein [Filimonas zeae]GGH65120.1 hypothetical protein GCM10011379_17920 [Filimonas zeae]
MSSNYSSRYFILAAVCCGVLSVSQAQFVNNYKKAADDYYAKGDFNSAAKYYEKYIGLAPSAKGGYDPYHIQKQGKASGQGNADALYRLGESYRHLTYYSNAEAAYKQVAETNAARYPLAQYWYAVCLRAGGKYAGAQQQLEAFLAKYTANDEYKKQATQELENLRFIQQQLAAGASATKLSKFDSGINQEGASYAAAWLNDGGIAFTSTRGTYNNSLYTAPAVSGAATPLAIPAADKKQQGVASFTADGNRVFFTAWDAKADGSRSSAIYTSEKKNNVWGQPVQLGNTVNEPGFNARQPQVTADGKYLLFASDKPGGAGKFDIWYAPLQPGGKAGKAVNAGTVINTAGNEEAPFYHQASGKLVFASDGKTGMGGFDLFEAKGAPEAAWEAPVNMGYPVNSVKDDIYFVSRQDKDLLTDAIISSDRSSACCLELFAVNRPQEVKAPVKEEPPVVVTPTPVPEEAPKPEVVVENNKALLQHVLFELDKAEPDEAGYNQLRAVAAYLQQHADVKVEIGAHTDGTGTRAHNLKLSQARAEVCVKFLVSEGIDKARLVAKGYGDCCPLEKETTADGKDNEAARAKNRRVEMKVL